MEIQSYKCPNCGGGLVFDPKTQKFKCEYCLSAFTEETLKEMEEAARKSEEASKPGGMPEAEKIESQKQAESKMVLYTCPSCGAEIVAQETTASTYCCYCHNPVVLSGSLDGKYRPDGLIPFEIDKKKAKEIFMYINTVITDTGLSGIAHLAFYNQIRCQIHICIFHQNRRCIASQLK